jgi:hypothetical protein
MPSQEHRESLRIALDAGQIRQRTPQTGFGKTLNRENAIVRPARDPSRTLLCPGDQTLGLAPASLHPFARRRLGGQHAVERGVDPLDIAIRELCAHAAPRGFSIQITQTAFGTRSVSCTRHAI